MEYPVEYDNLWMRTNRKINDKFLYINSCGFQNHSFKKHMTLRSGGRLDYLFLYITKGKCTADTKNGFVGLKSGDMLIYNPNEAQCYVFSENEDSEAVYIHFTGSAAAELVSFADGKNIVHTENNAAAVKILNRIINDFVEGTDNLMSVSWLIQLCELFKNSQKNFIDKRIAVVLKYMNENYHENNSIEFYGDMCGVSVDRFAHLFKNILGVSPHKYITGIRIRQAKYLLEYTDLNISEVATSVGFEDALYFSRIFKKYTGVSPQKYKG